MLFGSKSQEVPMTNNEKPQIRKQSSLLGSLLAFVTPANRKAEPEPLTQSALNEWLIRKIADATGMSVDEINIDTTFADFGLDSRTAVSMSTELERLIGRELPPTLIWDYPTIKEVSKYLIELSSADND